MYEHQRRVSSGPFHREVRERRNPDITTCGLQLSAAGACSDAETCGRGFGEVAKRSNAADCKSVAPAASEVRILPSPPTFRLRACGASAGQVARGWPPAGLDGSIKPAEDRRASLAAAPSEAKRARREGGSNSVVESQPSKLLVAGSIPVSRSRFAPGDVVPRTPYRRRSRGPVAPLRSGGRA